MANWSHGTVTTTKSVYTVPVDYAHGACWVDVQQAINAAIQQYRNVYDKSPSDDAIRVRVDDDAVRIEFVLPVDVAP